MKFFIFRLLSASLAIFACIASSDRLHAASATWTGATSGDFSVGANWSPAATPGNTTNGGTLTSDVATFNNAVNTAVTVDSVRTIGSVLFDTGAGAFTINGSSTLWLTTSSGTAGIVMNSGVTNSATINVNTATSRTATTYTFSNNSATSGVNLLINGSFTGVAASTTGLILGGSGNGFVSGALLNGSGGTLNLSKSGAGTWTLSGTNTYNGTTAIGGGALSVSSIANNLGTSSSAIGLGGSGTAGSFLYTGSGETTARGFDLAGLTGGGTINSSGTGALNITSGITAGGVGSKTLTLTGTNTGSNTIAGAIVDNLTGTNITSLIKSGVGKWVLAGTNTYTGSTAVYGGELALDFSAGTAPASNIIVSTSALTFGLSSGSGGTAASGALNFIGKANTANSQTFGSTATTLGVGAFHINLSTSGTGTMALTLGTIATTKANGFSLDLTLPAGTSVNPGGTVNNAAGVLPQGITINGTDFATKSGSSVVAFSAYTANTATTLGTTNQVVDMSGGSDTTLSSASSITALRFNNAAARTISQSGAATLLTVTSGILVTSNVGSNTSTITGGLLTGWSGRDLMILQNNTNGALQIGSTIVQNSNGGVLTKSGAGDLILSGTSSYANQNYINEGKVIVTSDPLAATTKTGTSSLTNATLSGIDTTGLWIGQRVTGSTLTGNTYHITAINAGANTVTLNSGTGVTAGSITFSMSGGSGLGSSTAANGVQIAPGATLQLGNGSTTGSLLDTQLVLNNGTLRFNRSNPFTYSSLTSGTGSVVQAGAGATTLAGTQTYTGATTVTSGTLIVNGSIATSSGVSVGASGTLKGSGTVSSISGAGLVSVGNSPGILTATQVDGSSGLDFTFEFTLAGSPTYSTATASGNDVLHLTNLTTPFVLALNSGNTLTVDFSGASLSQGQKYRGGFFTDKTDTANSLINSATFSYTGIGGYTVQYNGLVTEASAGFASGTVTNGLVMEFEIVPEPATWALLAFSLTTVMVLRRRRSV